VWFTQVPAPDDDVEVQVRAHGTPVAARVEHGDAERLRVRVRGELAGVAAGQSIVVYRGSQVLGQATVARAVRD